MELTPWEARVLGALIEKHMTTPDLYPLTTAGLRAACNQSSNRDPVVSYDEDTIIEAVNGLRDKELARTVKRAGERAIKHLETAEEGLDIDRRQKALLAVLLLRGSQTVGELRARTERYCNFADLDDVEFTLRSMESADIPTARLMARRPGQKEPRYTHLLGESGPDVDAAGGEDTDVSVAATPAPTPQTPDEAATLRLQVDSLVEAVAALRSEVAALKALIED